MLLYSIIITRAALATFNGFSNWGQQARFYRHIQGQKIYLLSVGLESVASVLEEKIIETTVANNINITNIPVTTKRGKPIIQSERFMTPYNLNTNRIPDIAIAGNIILSNGFLFVAFILF